MADFLTLNSLHTWGGIVVIGIVGGMGVSDPAKTPLVPPVELIADDRCKAGPSGRAGVCAVHAHIGMRAGEWQAEVSMRIPISDGRFRFILMASIHPHSYCALVPMPAPPVMSL